MKVWPVKSKYPVLFRRLGFLVTLAALLMPTCPNVALAANGNNPLASQPAPIKTPADGAQGRKSTGRGYGLATHQRKATGFAALLPATTE